MPARILREGIIESQRVNRLTDEEEVFYRRLMSIVDDYGRWEAHRALLRARLYPLKLDSKSEEQIGDLLFALVRERLVFIYVAEGKACLQVLTFNQQERSKSKFPPPDAQQLKAFASQALSTADEFERYLASAKQVIAGAHLVVCGFVCVCGVVCGVGDVVVGRPNGASAARTNDDAFSKERKPKSVEAVIAFGADNGVTAKDARKFHRYNETRKWKHVAGVPEGWRARLLVWKARGEEGFGVSSAESAKNLAAEVRDFDPTRPNAHTGGIPVIN